MLEEKNKDEALSGNKGSLKWKKIVYVFLCIFIFIGTLHFLKYKGILKTASNLNGVVTIKDNKLIYFDINNLIAPIEIGTVDTEENIEQFIFSESNEFIFYQNKGELYSVEIGKMKPNTDNSSFIKKIDSDVLYTEAYNEGMSLIYVKITNNDLYLGSLCMYKDGKVTVLAENVDPAFEISEDEGLVLYSVDGKMNSVTLDGKKTTNTLDFAGDISTLNLLNYSKNFDNIYYTAVDNDEVTLYHTGKDIKNEKLKDGILDIVSISEQGNYFYVKTSERGTNELYYVKNGKEALVSDDMDYIKNIIDNDKGMVCYFAPDESYNSKCFMWVEGGESFMLENMAEYNFEIAVAADGRKLYYVEKKADAKYSLMECEFDKNGIKDKKVIFEDISLFNYVKEHDAIYFYTALTDEGKCDLFKYEDGEVIKIIDEIEQGNVILNADESILILKIDEDGNKGLYLYADNRTTLVSSKAENFALSGADDLCFISDNQLFSFKYGEVVKITDVTTYLILHQKQISQQESVY